MTSTLNRSDTLLGVCEALGQDFGINPLWLRLAFAAGLFWSPWATIAGYCTLAAAVAVARWLTPARMAPTIAAEPAVANDDAPLPERLAA